MKYFLLLPVCLIFVFSSCKKKGDVVPGNVVTATIDGVDVNFNTVANAHYTDIIPATYAPTLVINGATTSNGITTSIVVTVTSPTPVTTGTVVSSDNGNIVAFCTIVYEQSVPGSQLTQPYITDNSGHYSTSVTITSISSTHVQGTFTGTLVNSIAAAQDPPKTVTNGKFNLTIN